MGDPGSAVSRLGLMAQVYGNNGGTDQANYIVYKAGPGGVDLGHADPTFNTAGALSSALGASGYVVDKFDFLHGNATNYRGYDPSQPEGLPSTHIPVPPGAGPLVAGHVDARYPYEDVSGLVEHTGSVLHSFVNWLEGVPQQ